MFKTYSTHNALDNFSVRKGDLTHSLHNITRRTLTTRIVKRIMIHGNKRGHITCITCITRITLTTRIIEDESAFDCYGGS